jgi:hypothetical protein
MTYSYYHPPLLHIHVAMTQQSLVWSPVNMYTIIITVMTRACNKSPFVVATLLLIFISLSTPLTFNSLALRAIYIISIEQKTTFHKLKYIMHI